MSDEYYWLVFIQLADGITDMDWNEYLLSYQIWKEKSISRLQFSLLHWPMQKIEYHERCMRIVYNCWLPAWKIFEKGHELNYDNHLWSLYYLAFDLILVLGSFAMQKFLSQFDRGDVGAIPLFQHSVKLFN